MTQEEIEAVLTELNKHNGFETGKKLHDELNTILPFLMKEIGFKVGKKMREDLTSSKDVVFEIL